MSAPMPAGGVAHPGERVGRDGGAPRHAGGWGAVPGLKAGANPSRSSAVEGKGCDRRARPHCTGCIE